MAVTGGGFRRFLPGDRGSRTAGVGSTSRRASRGCRELRDGGGRTDALDAPALDGPLGDRTERRLGPARRHERPPVRHDPLRRSEGPRSPDGGRPHPGGPSTGRRVCGKGADPEFEGQRATAGLN